MLLRNEDEARQFVSMRCDSHAFGKVESFAHHLRTEANVQNLIALSTLDAVWSRHIADSAQLLDHVSRETSPWVDFGTGAGFPGLIIAIMQPERDVVLIESRNLRIEWLTRMVDALELRKCRIVGQDVRQAEMISAAVISARAFAPLPRLIELSARFSTNVTEWVLPKGRSAAQDIAKLPQKLSARFHVKHSVTDPEARIVVARGSMGYC